jgi:gamma-glutamylcyclotransferase (GGCT)/AIG2-like uncharacterized protein YtfP
METDTPTNNITFFAYGTLRKGERLHGWIDEEIVSDLGTAVMRGTRLYFSTEHKAYPYLVFTGRMSDEAVGELYELPVNDNVISMLRMEQNAGYTISEGTVTLPNGEEKDVVVCSWKYEHGDEVPDNDWCSTERKEWWV